MKLRRGIATIMAAGCLAPAPALGDPGYLTTSAGLFPFNTATTVFAPSIPAAVDAVDAVITSDGRTAYLDGPAAAAPGDILTPVDLISQIARAGIPLAGAGPIAIAPDGHHAYVVDIGTDNIEVVDLTAGTTGPAITLASPPREIAIAPDGQVAYATTSEGVTPIDLTTDTPGAAIALSPSPQGIVISPDGSRAYVAAPESSATTGTVTPIDLASMMALAPIPVPAGSSELAISPDGASLYTLSATGQITPVDLTAGTPGVPLALRAAHGRFDRITLTPDGRTAYLVNHCESEDCLTSSLYRVDLVQMSAAGPSSVSFGPAYGVVAVAPSPQASFGSAPSPGQQRTPVDFDASESVDAGGAVSGYVWDFGDGTVMTATGPRVSHPFVRPGTYTVTLTTHNAGGCANAPVFTGRMAFCSGSSTATVTHRVTITPPPANPVTIARARVRVGSRGAVLALACARGWMQPSCRGLLVVSRGHVQLARARFAVARGATGKIRLALRQPGTVSVKLTIAGARAGSRAVQLIR